MEHKQKKHANAEEWQVVSASNLSSLLMVLVHLVEVIRISTADDVEQREKSALLASTHRFLLFYEVQGLLEHLSALTRHVNHDVAA